jgi:hypothetical protein
VWLAISPWPWRWVGYAGEVSAELIFWFFLFLIRGTYHERACRHVGFSARAGSLSPVLGLVTVRTVGSVHGPGDLVLYRTDI